MNPNKFNTVDKQLDNSSSLLKTINKAFKVNPEKKAIFSAHKECSYQELDNYSNAIALAVIKQNTAKGDIVAIYMERSMDLIVSIFGVLKSGAGFLVIDPAYPVERVKSILQSSGTKAIITTDLLNKKLETEIPALNYSTCISEAGANFNFESTIQISDDDLAYVIYTSGSTGVPKGVKISHGNLGHYIKALSERIGIDKSDRYLHTASFTFSSSVRQLMLPLCNTASIILASIPETQDPVQLFELIKKQCVTIIDLIPSYIRNCINVLKELKEPLKSNLLENDIRLVLSASEALYKEIAAQWMYTLKSSAAIINMYGQTETTGIVSTFDVPFDLEGENEVISIGTPIDGNELFILNEKLQQTEEGEIYIAGKNIGMGYIGTPELTPTNFIDHLFEDGNRRTLYKTGDIGRRAADDNIQFIGRIDNQIKLSGYRIAPEEIEGILKMNESIEESIVSLKKYKNEDVLVAYYSVKKNWEEVEDLRTYLGNKLPVYMLPAFYVEVDSFERTGSGKINRDQVLPTDFNAVVKNTYEAPVTDLEKNIQKIWEDVLGINSIGRNIQFFKEIGGSSLKAIQVVARIYKTLNVLINVGDIFSNQTISKLAAFIENFQKEQVLPLTKAPKKMFYDLSLSQMRVWLIEQMKSAPSAYNIECIWDVEGALDFEALKDAFKEIVFHHDSLRMNFVVVNGTPKIKIKEKEDVKFDFTQLHTDLRNSSNKASEANRILRAEINRIFDIEKELLISLHVIQLEDKKYTLTLTLHHIISDAWSLEVIFNQFGKLYNAYYNKQKMSLPEQKLGFIDFSEWQTEVMKNAGKNDYLNYWKTQLKDTQVLRFQRDEITQLVDENAGEIFNFTIDSEILNALKRISKEMNTTLYTVLMAAYYIFLNKQANSSDIVIGAPIANRNRKELEDIVGFFLNTLAIRINPEKEISVKELIGLVKQNLLDAYKHQDVPFEQIVQELQPERTLTHTPIFQTIFVLNNTPFKEIKLPDLTLSPVILAQQVSTNFDLSMSLIENIDSINGKMEYKINAFTRETIQLMIHRFTQLLQTIIADQSILIKDIDLKMEFEKKNRLTNIIKEGELF